MFKASIIGANGYTGLELMNILSRHQGFQVQNIVSRSMAGREVNSLYPSLLQYKNKYFTEHNKEEIAKTSDVVFLCLPHTQSFEVAQYYYDKGVKVVDLSADFRYDDSLIYEEWYKTPHLNANLKKKAVYGLSEIYAEEIKTADIVANPGCYTTCSILPLYPLIKEKLISYANIIIDSKSGVSGAGRKAEESLMFTEVTNNFKAYGLCSHRHTSEIEEQLSKAAESKIKLSFTPHLLPINRGILSTIYGNLNEGVCSKDIEDALNTFYRGKNFITILEEGKNPEIKAVAGSNNCFIGYNIDKRLNRVILVSVLDNLIKGASGQAVQNANLMFGLDETMGLEFQGRYI